MRRSQDSATWALSDLDCLPNLGMILGMRVHSEFGDGDHDSVTIIVTGGPIAARTVRSSLRVAPFIIKGFLMAQLTLLVSKWRL